MMTKELLQLVAQMCREKGIPREVVFSALESALLSAARKKHGGRTNVHLTIDRTSGDIDVYETKMVVEEVENKDEQMTLAQALEIREDAAIGMEVVFPLDIHDLGRIAAQTAKQVIFQRVRDAERDVIYGEFKDKIGQIISGTVIRRERTAYFLGIGRTEAVLNLKDTLPGENLKRGDVVRAIIEDIKSTSKGPIIQVSRTHPDFVRALFKMEVPEIYEGLVIIKDVVREPGERTKIAVVSKDNSVDPVGACVGMKGTRVQSIVRELRGERIDIIPWTDDPRMLIARALSPATIEKVGINEEDKSAMVVVNDQQLSIAIGKKGQNVRLAMKLTGWDIDILSDTEYSKMKLEEAEKHFGEAATKDKAEAAAKDTAEA